MFKKILLFALASLMLLACAKVSEPTEKLVTVTFDYRLVEENSMYATKAMYKNNYVATKEIMFNRYDNVGLIFCQGTYTDVSLKITLTPSDATRYQETEFGFSTNSATQKYTYVQPGKFYKLHPATLGSSGPIIGIGFPAFEEGMVKDE